MKLTLTWLKQYVDFDCSPEELAERLIMLALDGEGVLRKSSSLSLRIYKINLLP
jgi:hypothetical protein